MKKIALIDVRSFLAIILVGVVLVIAVGCSSDTSGEETGPEEIRLDYAYYSPTSLVLKKFGWAEEEFEEEGIEIEWALSQGSNKALEFLNSDSVDFGSTAGAAALISKSNGSPIQNVYIYSKPEWTALVTNPDSDIESVADLTGKKVAATIGTDPYIFLLRALAAENIDPDEVEIVNLQHGDGASSLVSGQVDAWAGLDPHMARLEIEADAELFYRNADFNTYGFLNVRNEFAENYPDYVNRVIKVYEKARNWILENPEEAAELLAEEADIDVEVAKIQLERNDFSNPIPGDVHIEALIESGGILQDGEVIDADANIEELTNELINPAFAEETVE
ncbi:MULTISPECIES: aliphatic sulfonate ABC transporter substrate-binding protein [Paraliobacillus]|uniref:aliphatic sulfonate ABC transporter substrate-binding protein n=1 Tax=Paraliobacillus TaxID=200903 RepID=UPI000DD40CD3|nr:MULTISPECIES: aliphatic sulfonate ABC transporter substrate-binding protein [Paraliobacillus]